MKQYKKVVIYIDADDTYKEFKSLLKDFNDGDEAVRSILYAYKASPMMFKVNFS